jgi:hypothetical protein
MIGGATVTFQPVIHYHLEDGKIVKRSDGTAVRINSLA